MPIILTLLLALLFFNNLTFAKNIPDVDFMESMSGGSQLIIDNVFKKNKGLEHLGINNRDFLEIIAKHYSLKYPSKMPYNKDPLIPKVIHQIWVGPIPPLYKNYMEECQLLHPDWEFKLWKNEDVDELNMKYRNLYDLSRSYVQKSDILRYDILLQYGGVYRDMDVKCYRPLDELNHKYDFYVGLEFKGIINNGFIGAVPNHPIIKEILDQINNNLPLKLTQYDNGELDYPTYYNFILRTSFLPLNLTITHKSKNTKGMFE